MLQFDLSETVALKTLKDSEAPALCALVDENREYLRQWLPWLDQNTQVDHLRRFIESTQPDNRDDGGFVCGVFVEDQLAGVCGFHDVNLLNHSVWIGYWLAENQQGKGAITMCARFFINYAFSELKLNKIMIPVATGNARSRAVCERLGLKSEGIDREGEFLYDRYVDLVGYSLLRSEWATQSKWAMK